MSKPIRLFKLVTGELVLGKFDEEANMLEDVAIIQVVPTQQGVQMMMLPYGYPSNRNSRAAFPVNTSCTNTRSFPTISKPSIWKPAPT